MGEGTMPEQTYAERKNEERIAAHLEATRVNRGLTQAAKALAKKHHLTVQGEQWSRGQGGLWLNKGHVTILRLSVRVHGFGFPYSIYVKMEKNYSMRERPYLARHKPARDLEPYIERMREIVQAGIQQAKATEAHAKTERAWQKKVVALAKDLGMPVESDYTDFITSSETAGYYRTTVEGVEIVLRMLGNGSTRVEIETTVADLEALRRLLTGFSFAFQKKDQSEEDVV